MAKKEWYRQCRYERPTERGKKFDVAWIPEKFGKVGKKIYFGKKLPAPPDEVWTVTEVGDTRRTGKEITDFQNASKHQREVSDV